MSRRRIASWGFALAISSLLRQSVGFLGSSVFGHPKTPSRRKSTLIGAYPRQRDSRSCCTQRGTTRPRRSITPGVRGLSAAFEVELGQNLEIGSVLVSGPENYGHMTFKAVALVYEHGEGCPTRAVCIDKGLDFTIGEMSSGDLGPLSNNRLFRGGDEGGEAAIMIHPHDVQGARALGDTGLFVGGFVSALDLVDEGGAKPGDFKFFFNHMYWPEGALEEQVDKGLWKLVRLPNEVLLETKRMRDMELWGRVEFALKKKVEH